MKALLKRHPQTTIIWAHSASAASSRPVARSDRRSIEALLAEPAAAENVYFDISWDEVAKYVVASPETHAAADLVINRHPDRFLFGTDEVAPSDQAKYLKVYEHVRAALLAS